MKAKKDGEIEMAQMFKLKNVFHNGLLLMLIVQFLYA